jgi:hypothetical protein
MRTDGKPMLSRRVFNEVSAPRPRFNLRDEGGARGTTGLSGVIQRDAMVLREHHWTPEETRNTQQ